MFRISVSYILLCGQFLLLLTILLLQCLEGIHSQNSSDTPGNGLTLSATTVSYVDQADNGTNATTVVEEPLNEPYEYNGESPVVLCRYL